MLQRVIVFDHVKQTKKKGNTRGNAHLCCVLFPSAVLRKIDRNYPETKVDKTIPQLHRADRPSLFSLATVGPARLKILLNLNHAIPFEPSSNPARRHSARPSLPLCLSIRLPQMEQHLQSSSQPEKFLGPHQGARHWQSLKVIQWAVANHLSYWKVHH